MEETWRIYNGLQERYLKLKDKYKKVLIQSTVMCIIASITIIGCAVTILMQNNQIKTQAEYIEWQERIERETEIESEHMNMLEEMRKGNE